MVLRTNPWVASRFGPKQYTTLLAWFQIIFSGFVIGQRLVSTIWALTIMDRNKFGFDSFPWNPNYGLIAAVIVLSIIFPLLEVGMGFLLHFGAKENITRCLKTWIVYSTIMLLWCLFNFNALNAIHAISYLVGLYAVERFQKEIPGSVTINTLRYTLINAAGADEVKKKNGNIRLITKQG